jgi:hypothetical protein
VRSKIEKKWFEGENNDMIGILNLKYVEIIKYDGIRKIKKRKSEGKESDKLNLFEKKNIEI